MIKKFTRIKSLGRFRDFAVAGDQELRKLNLFFGDNGRGKTTIAAILRSLKSGDPRYVKERTTLGSGAAPEIAVLLTGSVATFNGTAWNTTCDAIEVFDHRFITDNVHIGDSVETQNKRNLATVILGQKGAEISQRIKNLDELAREKLASAKTFENQLGAHKPGSMTLQAFIELPAHADIEQKISDKTGELEAAKQASALKAQPLLTPLPIPGLPKDFKGILLKTLESVSAEAEARVRAHLAQEHVKEAEEWLSEGVAFLSAETCPVCGQSLKGIDLIAAYKTYFSDAYRALRSEVNDLDASLDKSLGDAFESAFIGIANANAAPLAFWQSLVEFAVPEVPSPDTFKTERTVAFQEAARNIAAKKVSLLEKVVVDEVLTGAISKLDAACAAVKAYNATVTAANIAIAELKAKIAAASQAMIQSELDRLRAIKQRHAPEIAAQVTEYLKVKRERENAIANKNAVQAELSEFAKSIVRKYERRINEILANFGTGFRIKGVQTSFPAGTPASSYGIEINSVVVEAGKIPDKAAPSFQTMLGAGDKSALALALFLATLDQAPDKSSKILLLDDPFSSQDEHRRLETCRLIHHYTAECAQMIVSSHVPTFLRQVWDEGDSSNIRCLKLTRKGEDDTTIIVWDIETETKHPYLQLHEKLVAYCNGKITWAAEDVIQKPRTLLEDYIRFRFPNTFGPKQWLGDMISHIRTAGKSHPMWDHLSDLEAVNGFTSPAHHGSSTTAAATTPTEGEIVTHVRRALKIVGNL